MIYKNQYHYNAHYNITHFTLETYYSPHTDGYINMYALIIYWFVLYSLTH